MGVFRTEKKILDFVGRYFGVILLVCITAVALYVRFKMLNFESGDFLVYLEPWSDEIKNRGLRDIFSSGGVGDYNSPYILLMWFLTKLPFSMLFSIKIVSVVFDFGLAVMAALIVRFLLKKKKTEKRKINFMTALAYAAVILLPTVMLNGALWGQCDSIYAFFVLTSIYCLLRKKYNLSFIFLGFAFSFKLQFIFVLPVYLMIYLRNKEFSLLQFLWIPAVLVFMSIPALICGLPFMDIFGIYFEQVGEYQKMTLANMNIWQVFRGDYEYASLIGYAICALLFGFIMYRMTTRPKKIDTDNIIPLMLLSVLICICFLPSMHERYGYLADVLSVVYFAVGYGSLLVPFFIELLSLMGYFVYLFGLDISGYRLLGLVPVFIIIYVGRKLLGPYEKIDGALSCEKKKR